MAGALVGKQRPAQASTMIDCCGCSLDMRRTLSMKPMLLVTSMQTQMTTAMDMGPQRRTDVYLCCNTNATHSRVLLAVHSFSWWLLMMGLLSDGTICA